MRKTKTYQQVVDILEANRISPMSGVGPRDSDTELIIQLLQFSGASFNAEQLAMIRNINFESVTRCRRKLQEEGKYLPSPEVARKRRLKGYGLQQTAPGESAAGVQRRIEENL